MATLFTVLILSVLGSAQTTDARVWQVQFGADGGTPVSASSNSGVIEFRNEKAVAFTIPAASITSIFHTTQQVRRSTQAFNFFEGICCGGTDSHLLSALAYLVATPFGSSKSEYVEIDWTSKGAGSVQLRMAADEYVPFMEWVSQLSGVHWRDLDREREEAVKQIEQHANLAFPVLDGSWIRFQALPIETGDHTMLYLFEGKVLPKNLVAIVPVTEEFADNSCVHEPEAEILYGLCRANRCQIQAVLRRNLTYRVGSLPRTYTVDANGLSVSECPAVETQKKQGESVSSTSMRKTIKKTE